MRRYDGSVSFGRSWEEYSSGFGSTQSEHWMGLYINYYTYLMNKKNICSGNIQVFRSLNYTLFYTSYAIKINALRLNFLFYRNFV